MMWLRARAVHRATRQKRGIIENTWKPVYRCRTVFLFCYCYHLNLTVLSTT